MKRLFLLALVAVLSLYAVNVSAAEEDVKFVVKNPGETITVSTKLDLLGQSGSAGDDAIVKVYGMKGMAEPEPWKKADWPTKLDLSYRQVAVDNPSNLPVTIWRLTNAVNMAHYGTHDGKWQGQLVMKLVICSPKMRNAAADKRADYGDTPDTRRYLWISPVIAANSDPNMTRSGSHWVVWPGNYVFDVKADGGELSQKFIEDLQGFGHGGVLVEGGRFDGDVRRALAYREVTITGAKMIVRRGDGAKVAIEPKDDFFRRALYPVEPTKENDWEGWPK